MELGNDNHLFLAQRVQKTDHGKPHRRSDEFAGNLQSVEGSAGEKSENNADKKLSRTRQNESGGRRENRCGRRAVPAGHGGSGKQKSHPETDCDRKG